MLLAERHDLGIEDEVAPGIRLQDAVMQQSRVAIAGREDTQARTLQQRIQRLRRLGQRAGWPEDARMRRDAEELAEDEDRQRPCGLTFGQLPETMHGDLVEHGLRSVRVEQDVGIDRDQRRSSMRS